MNTRLQRVCFVDVDGKRNFTARMRKDAGYAETGWMLRYAVFYDIDNFYRSECIINFVVLRRSAQIKTDAMINCFMAVFAESPVCRIYEILRIAGRKDGS